MIRLYKTLQIGATTKDTGKTGLICSILKNVSKENEVIVLKFTLVDDFNKKSIDKDFIIVEETSNSENTDTSRYLQAGAKKAFWIKVKKETIKTAIDEVIKIIGIENIFIIESNSTRHFIEPDTFIMIKNTLTNEVKPSAKEVNNYVDYFIESDDIEEFSKKIILENNVWKIKV